MEHLGCLTVPVCWYVVMVFFWALIFRLVLSVLKAWATQSGEPDDNCGNMGSDYSWSALVWLHFKGFNGTIRDDNWVPFFIGVAELGVYPFLLNGDRLDILGAWLAFKTLPLWGTWQKRRNAYNRFLLGCLLPLAVAWYWVHVGVIV